MRFLRLLLAGVLVLLFVPVSFAENVHTFQLENGLQIFVKEDHRVPVVVTQVWYKVGSSYEHGGITGVSHMLEHMMFRGSKNYGPGEFSRIIAKNGGRENAFTSYDYTGYYQVLAADKLEISFQLEADRMRHLLLDKGTFTKEQQVVIEERRMRTEDNPNALTYERYLAAAHVASPYHHPVIGWMNDIENLTIDDLSDWYKTWYAPNNAAIVVVGDVQPQQVLAMAKQYFGPLEPQVIPVVKPQKALPRIGKRELVVRAPATVPWLIMGYNVPVLKDDPKGYEPYALSLIAGVLDAGSSSRLSSELVRKHQVAANAGAGYHIYSRLSSLFSLEATPAQERSIDEIRAALLAQIEILKKELVTQAELDRVKAQVIASKVYENDSLSSQANEIGRLVTVGLSYSEDERYLEKISSITPEQLREVANKYFVNEGLTIARLDPLVIAKTQKKPKVAGGPNAH